MAKETIWLDKDMYINILKSIDNQIDALQITLNYLKNVEVFTSKERGDRINDR